LKTFGKLSNTKFYRLIEKLELKQVFLGCYTILI
jgi:hypothetical protein